MMPVAAYAAPSPVSLFGASFSETQGTDIFANGSSMSMNAAAVSTGPSQLPFVAAGPGSAGVSGVASTSAPFADLLTEAVGKVEQYESQAKSAIEGLMSGQGVDVHQAMIATDQAATGFELVLAVRNKALSAYQQVMGLQF